MAQACDKSNLKEISGGGAGNRFVLFFAMKPSSGRRARTGGHWTAKEIERNARDAAMKPSSGRRARTSGHWTAKEIERDARDAAMKPSSAMREMK